MFDPLVLLAFVGAVVLLALTPGPDMALVVGRGMFQGCRPALFTALGFFLAGAVQVPLLALGVATLVHDNPLLFDLLRYGGGAYLIWRGWKMIATAGDPSFVEASCVTSMLVSSVRGDRGIHQQV